MKKRTKKLTLAKETVRSLEGGDMRTVAGGFSETCGCPWLTDGYGSCPCQEEVSPSYDPYC